MSDSPDKKTEISTATPKPVAGTDEQMEDEEKIMAGRADANYPAMLTKDVPGG